MDSQDRFSAQIDEFLDHLIAYRGASEHTAAAYRVDLMQAADLFASWGLNGWNEVDEVVWVRMQAALGPPLAPSTAMRKLSSLRSMLRFLKRQGGNSNLQLPSASFRRRQHHLPHSLTHEDLLRLLESADSSEPQGLRDRALLELIYGTGLRISEALGIRLEQVDLDSAALNVTGKREKTRFVPIPPETVSWLEKYLLNARPKLLKRAIPNLIVSDRGNPMNRSVAYGAIRKYAVLAGIEGKWGPHALRHTYAVHLLKGGADLRAVQELLGHESISTTQIYTELDMDHAAAAYRKAHPRR